MDEMIGQLHLCFEVCRWKNLHGLVIAIDSWIHLLLIHVYFSWTTGTWKFYFYFTGYCFSWTKCVFIGSSICTWKIRTHQYLLLISLVPWCILLKEFINLYHEQNLCLCVLHMVYHGVEESTTPCYSGIKYISWAKPMFMCSSYVVPRGRREYYTVLQWDQIYI